MTYDEFFDVTIAAAAADGSAAASSLSHTSISASWALDPGRSCSTLRPVSARRQPSPAHGSTDD